MRQVCDDAEWRDVLPACADYCRPTDGCVTVPTCATPLSCGQGESCCNARIIPRGTFSRSYDGVGEETSDPSFLATVGGLRLDRFEVTVSRFRSWLRAYDISTGRPRPGDGKHRADAQGWLSSWDQNLPATSSALTTRLTSCANATWTELPGANEQKPIHCVSWFVAQAFCIWDRGRLPTEAEWNYAAAGGEQQRVYPWSTPSNSPTIDASRAVFGASASIANVGSRSPAGDGRWGHADLAGNVSEWVLDDFEFVYPTTMCQELRSADRQRLSFVSRRRGRELRGISRSQRARL